ncbi:hypothetical protein [Gemmatimonas groenlandica]|uniref:Cell division protein FtsL n=1 Tax=Gemmatimonas groenlandica TaxID=2732249 RepID=A0A6M4IP68_9BACT|nr:hypothetical protein [Gemmatimonas groenlandica]QJR35307.1 hypothetical protein HKW67_07210 [Gemmatimonas groenlandica]
MATTSTKRTRRSPRGPLKGRAWIAIGLGVFLVVASIVVWRRGVGASTVREMSRLSNRQRALLSEKTTLDRDIRSAMARSRVISEAERRLGLHVATDAQTRMLSDSMLADPERPDTVASDSASRS